MLGCPLRVSPDLIMPIKTLTTAFELPNSTLLLGTRFYQQAIGAWGFGDQPTEWASSRGGVGVIGR